MRSPLPWLGALLLAGSLTASASADPTYPGSYPVSYPAVSGPSCGAYGCPAGPSCYQGVPSEGEYSSCPEAAAKKSWWPLHGCCQKCWASLQCRCHDWWPFHHECKQPGLAQFATHPFARSPRDFYMVDVNP